MNSQALKHPPVEIEVSSVFEKAQTRTPAFVSTENQLGVAEEVVKLSTVFSKFSCPKSFTISSCIKSTRFVSTCLINF